MTVTCCFETNVFDFSMLVYVVVKVLDHRDQGDGVTYTPKRMPKTLFVTADASASMKLTLWGRHNVVVGLWYKFSDVCKGL